MIQYRITLKSDSGKFTFTGIATDEETAKLIVLKSEGAPESAIIKTKFKKYIYKHKTLEQLAEEQEIKNYSQN